MFKALREVLGSHVSQQGSEISPEALRFDFNHFESLTDEQILKVESLTNEYINKEYKMKTVEVSIDEARKLGATAEFGEKYGDLVRVVDLGSTIDVCGGTHVENTKDIGKFMIYSISSIGSGIYRVVGLTKSQIDNEESYFKGYKEDFRKLLNKAHELENKAKEKNINLIFDYKPNEKYEFSYNDVLNMRKESQALQMEVKTFEKLVNKKIDEASASSFTEYEKYVNDRGAVIEVKDFDRSKLRNLIDHLSSLKPQTVIALLFNDGNKAQLLVKSTNDAFDASSILKTALNLINGRGGGNKTFAQGAGDSNGAQQVLDYLNETIMK